jgi:hypothetical protein
MRIVLFILMLLISCREFAQDRYSLFIKGNDGASCMIMGVRDMKKKEVALPANVSEALQCPMLAAMKDTLLVYNDTASVNLYNIITGKNFKLFALPVHCDGVSGPCWSPSFRKAMFVVINQNKDESYSNICRIVVITFNNKGEVIAEEHFDRMVNYQCGSFCSSTVGEDFTFISDDRIRYKRHELMQDRQGEMEEISLTK